VVALFLRFISQVGMLPFVLYRLILGAWLLILFW
jgi:undecaprenyl-diphosphatase